MDSALDLHRLQFAFTVAFHYLFPQLTMGLALLIVLMKTLALRTGEEGWNEGARFWARIFAVNFAMGVVTGIPLEFQFGTNWSRFAGTAGGVIGQTLAMEGTFAFFLESTFLGLFLFGEKRIGPRAHWWAAFLVFLGAWMSGFFIVTTNAWMQHPVGHEIGADGKVEIVSLAALLLNPWGLWQYLHTMLGSVVTAAFFVSSVGAFYLLSGRDGEHGRRFLRLGVPVALAASFLSAFPAGDQQARMVARHQPASFAAMEGHFHTGEGVALVMIGQPDMEKRRLDNPIHLPRVLSFLTWNSWSAEVKGLDAFPEEEWPTNVPLVYYAYRVMVGLGTLFIGLAGAAAVLLWRGRLFDFRPVLWALMFALPFPYIANTAGWITAEAGRQPWVIHGILRTADAHSPQISSGNVMFTLIGFAGMYALLGILFLLLVVREISHGPGGHGHSPAGSAGEPGGAA
ncbi:MAG: cytochrome ubiquinol oxidase subunit I [Planctomycetaceae bacterium]|nr:cytochrome ubiquinol oxidase subunit I [Planctomycetota bacterium]NUN51574.1 cytochrome ubiquinol oxidase subunit I [Planctomycetaceae bacterium]